MPTTGSTTYECGSWEVDPTRRELRSGGVPVPIVRRAGGGRADERADAAGGAARLAPRRATRLLRHALCVPIIVGFAAILGACGETHPLYGPASPRDGAGRPVDPIYGTPLPGYPLGGGG